MILVISRLCLLFNLVAIVLSSSKKLYNTAEASNNHKNKNNTNYLQRLIDNDDSDFPKIFEAVVAILSSSFLSEVDLLRPDIIVDSSEGKAKGSFIIHSQQQYEYLLRLQKKSCQECVSRFQIDHNRTKFYKGKRRRRRRTRQKFIRGKDLNDTNKRKTSQKQYSTINGYPCYRDLDGIEKLMKDLVEIGKRIPNLIVTLTDIGDSFVKTQQNDTGYDIWALNITGNGIASTTSGRGGTEKGYLFAMSGIHPREYAPPELLSQFAESLILGYNNDAEITSILDHTEIHLVLQANPDGRSIDETNQQYRRKNLNNLHGDESLCGSNAFGVDLNRNFPFMWGQSGGSSNHPCSDAYRGPHPASEPEVKAITDYVNKVFPKQQRKNDPTGQRNLPYPTNTTTGIFLDIHSYGEILFFPWGHANENSGNKDEFLTLASRYAQYNNYDVSGSGYNFDVTVSGVSDDYAYGMLGVASMTFELGTTFYEDCEYFHNDIVPRNIPALIYAAKVSKAPYKIPKGPEVTALMISPSNVINIKDIDGAKLTVIATIRDGVALLSSTSGTHSTVSSTIDASSKEEKVLPYARLYLGKYPYDTDENGNTPNGIFMSDMVHVSKKLAGGRIVDIVEATRTLRITEIISLLGGSENRSSIVGRHYLYVQGYNSDGYAGPVFAEFLEIVDGNTTDINPTPTYTPTRSSATPNALSPAQLMTAIESSSPSSVGYLNITMTTTSMPPTEGDVADVPETTTARIRTPESNDEVHGDWSNYIISGTHLQTRKCRNMSTVVAELFFFSSICLALLEYYL